MAVQALLGVALWVGHACIWTFLLNNFYGRRIPKTFLKPWRLVTGVVILAALPILWWSNPYTDRGMTGPDGTWSRIVDCYFAACWFIGLIVFPTVTAVRQLRRKPRGVLGESTRSLDLWKEFGAKLYGNGKWRLFAYLPFNCIFRVDFTELELAPERLPPEWDGLTILLLSDIHFHGTPSREYFQRILDEVNRQPPADIVALAGDYVDSDAHREWIAPLLGQLKWTECGLAILGNHDEHHGPNLVREGLAKLGFRVLSNRSGTISIRGVPCEMIGHEGPWFQPDPVVSAKSNSFRLCLSHSPDNFYWGQRHGIDLMLCGHVHGGQIRLPVIGSIFVPSVYSRRFDMGVFEREGTLMVVGRGLSGKEPLRFNCHPQVIRITLKCRPPGGVG